MSRYFAETTDFTESSLYREFFELLAPGRLLVAELTSSDGVVFDNHFLIYDAALFMAALCNRARHYIFTLWFLLPSIFFFFFSWPNLSGRRLDVYHTSTHGESLVRI